MNLGDIEARARTRRRYCENCDAAAVNMCVGGGDCNTVRCETHTVFCDNSCTHRWMRLDDGVEDTLALVARVRELEALLAASRR